MHEAKFHFISGLPRSGSTLLGALLLQNKRHRASMSSPVASLTQRMSRSLGIRNEWSPLIDGEQRRRILASLLYAYYGSDPEKDIIFDTKLMTHFGSRTQAMIRASGNSSASRGRRAHHARLRDSNNENTCATSRAN